MSAVPDIQVRDEGSICLLSGESDDGQRWLEESLDPDAQRWGRGYVVEPRYVGDIVRGARDDGLLVA